MTEFIGKNVSLLLQTPPTLYKANTDSETERTQSAIVRKLVRKTADTSIARRSSSLKSSEKSCESMIVSKFYTKMGSSQLTNDTLAKSIRLDILNRREDHTDKKKREPTPVPGHLSRKRNSEILQKKESEIENDLFIAEIQKKLNEQMEKTKIYEKRVQMSEKQLKIKTNKILDLQRRLSAQVQQQKLLQTKLKSFQQLAAKNQTCLVQTKSALQKMKKNILQNRYAEMQAQNAKFRRETQSMKDLNQKLSQQLKFLQAKSKNLELQINVLKNLPKIEAQKSKEPMEQVKELKVKNEYIVKLQNTISKLQIKMNYLNRRKNEELQKLKQKKNVEMAKVRNRLSQLNYDFNQVRKQNQTLRKKVAPQRTTLMSCSSWFAHDQVFYLSLSP